MRLPQIVIDTNVLVSALRSREGYGFQLVTLLGKGKFTVHLSVRFRRLSPRSIFMSERNGQVEKNLKRR
ncbi:MAG: PIN domain-containing protein [Chloroflexota bacterium]|nr:PIN domain-containing protein [Chloroflexota bacterium]